MHDASFTKPGIEVSGMKLKMLNKMFFYHEALKAPGNTDVRKKFSVRHTVLSFYLFLLFKYWLYVCCAEV